MLSRYKKVDSYGKIFRNCEIPEELEKLDQWEKINSELYKQYKFVICFENSYSANYITEKLLLVMYANAIPIYRGAPNVSKYFNTKAFINYEDYGRSYEKMIEKIIELDNNDEKYREFAKQSFLNDDLFYVISEERKKLVRFLCEKQG